MVNFSYLSKETYVVTHYKNSLGGGGFFDGSQYIFLWRNIKKFYPKLSLLHLLFRSTEVNAWNYFRIFIKVYKHTSIFFSTES